MLQHYGEPPAWDAFSKVDVRNIDPSEYEDEEELRRKQAEQTAIVKAKPTTISGWDPETKTQPILTDEQMNQGCGMGAVDLDHWKVTCMSPPAVEWTVFCHQNQASMTPTWII